MKQHAWLGLASFVLVASLGLGACSSDEDDGGNAGGSAGTGGKGGSGGSGTGGSGTGGSGTGGSGTGGSGTGGSGTGGSGTGGAGGDAGGAGVAGAAGATSGFDAEAFCTQYGTVCTFGGAQRFASHDDCVTQTSAFSAARQTCIQTHLDFAENLSDTTTHCPHATGLGPGVTYCAAS